MKIVYILFFSFLFCSLNAQTKTYHTNGNLHEVGYYDKDGIKIGLWTKYFISGSPYSLNTYYENKRDFIQYHENGEVRESGTYTNTRKTGEWLKFDKNGCLTSIGIIKDGAYTGERKRYHMDQISAIEHYKNRKKTGKWIWYGHDKLIKRIENYKYGKGHGEIKSFFKDGKLSFERFYEHGTPIGIHKEYTQNGVLKIKTVYEEGKKVEKRNFYPNGKLSHLVTFIGDKRLEKGYHYVGKNLSHIGYSIYLESGFRKIGEWKSYHENGKLHDIGNYEDGKLTGQWKGWHPNGKRKYKSVYVNDEEIGVYYDENGKHIRGKKTGKWKGWHDNGKRKFKGVYENDKKIGVWKHYDEKGKRKEIDVEKQSKYF